MANWFSEMIADIRAHLIHDDRAENLGMPDPTGAFGHGPGEGAMPSSEHLQNLRDLFGMDDPGGNRDRPESAEKAQEQDRGIDR